jgi:uncharacterized protein
MSVVSLDQLYADLLEEQSNSKSDIRIARDGTWYHEGTRIDRAPLVKIFASILKREGEDYFLVTPVEKWRLKVDDAPLYVIAVQRTLRNQQQALVFTTLTDDKVLASAENPIRVAVDSNSGEPSPYLLVRNQLEGLISRSVYYELADMVEERQIDNAPVLGVTSMGAFFPLS